MGNISLFERRQHDRPWIETVLCPKCSAPMRGRTLNQAYTRMFQHMQAQHDPLSADRLTLAVEEAS